jgi:hypothetical protein
MLVPFESPGVSDVGDAYVHMGFLTAYNAVASNVISVVERELEIHPGYSIVSTGQLFCFVRSGGISNRLGKGIRWVQPSRLSVDCLSKPTF